VQGRSSKGELAREAQGGCWGEGRACSFKGRKTWARVQLGGSVKRMEGTIVAGNHALELTGGALGAIGKGSLAGDFVSHRECPWQR